MTVRKWNTRGSGVGLRLGSRRVLQLGLVLLAAGALPACAKHADYIELRDEVGNLARTQDQVVKRQDQIQRRLQALEGGSHPMVEEGTKSPDVSSQRVQELTIRISDLESRLSRVEEGQAASPARPEESQPKISRAPDAGDLVSPGPSVLPGTPAISPTSAFNLAYNDYLNGRYELAITGFQRFLKDFPTTSLAPNAHYWIGESYYSLKDYARALQSFQKVINDYPKNEKVPPALFKLGIVAAEAGDVPKARSYLRRVIEEHATSDEAKLAKNKLAELR